MVKTLSFFLTGILFVQLNAQELDLYPPNMCPCTDTPLEETKSTDLLRQLMEYGALKKAFPELCLYLDSSFYNRRLFVGSHNAANTDTGSLQIFAQGPADLRLSDKDMPVLRLNPCYTPGDYSELNLNYIRKSGEIAQSAGWLVEPHLELIMQSSFLRQHANGEVKFSYNPEKLQFNESDGLHTAREMQALCFDNVHTAAWVLQEASGNLVLHSKPMRFLNKNKYIDLSVNLKFAPKLIFLRKVSGVHVNSGSGYLNLNGQKIPWSTDNVWMTDHWTGGRFTLGYADHEGDEFSVKTDEGEWYRTSHEALNKLLREAGFQSDIRMKKRKGEIQIEFFQWE